MSLNPNTIVQYRLNFHRLLMALSRGEREALLDYLSQRVAKLLAKKKNAADQGTSGTQPEHTSCNLPPVASTFNLKSQTPASIGAMNTTGEIEPPCAPDRKHYWVVRSLSGVGFIEEKACVNCPLVAHRTPPLVRKGEVVKRAGYRYTRDEK